MINRINVGRKYNYRGRYVTVASTKEGVRGWMPKMVVIRDSDGELETHTAYCFRREAEHV